MKFDKIIMTGVPNALLALIIIRPMEGLLKLLESTNEASSFAVKVLMILAIIVWPFVATWFLAPAYYHMWDQEKDKKSPGSDSKN